MQCASAWLHEKNKFIANYIGQENKIKHRFLITSNNYSLCLLCDKISCSFAGDVRKKKQKKMCTESVVNKYFVILYSNIFVLYILG